MPAAASPTTGGAKRVRTEIEFDVDEFLASTAAQQTDLDSVILGIDEAGRGPVLGDMVYGGAIVSLREHQKILATGATDSKALTEANRERIRGELEVIPTFKAIEKSLTPNDIADAMFSRTGRNLNTISHEAAIAIIHEATIAARGKLCAVYVDTVGIPEAYQRLLQGRFPHLNITVAKKADAKFPIVSAASIFAKTTRDRGIQALSEEFGPLGSGYPGDQATINFLKNGHAHRFFGFTPKYDLVRQSWGPVVNIARTACIKMEWQHEIDDKSKSTKGQPKLNEGGAVRRDSVYAKSLCMTVQSGLSSDGEAARKAQGSFV